MTSQELIDNVLRLLAKAGVDASLYPVVDEDESPLIRTRNCLIIFAPDSVMMQWNNNYRIAYDDHTARAILSDFVPDVDSLLEGES